MHMLHQSPYTYLVGEISKSHPVSGSITPSSACCPPCSPPAVPHHQMVLGPRVEQSGDKGGTACHTMWLQPLAVPCCSQL